MDEEKLKKAEQFCRQNIRYYREIDKDWGLDEKQREKFELYNTLLICVIKERRSYERV